MEILGCDLICHLPIYPHPFSVFIWVLRFSDRMALAYGPLWWFDLNLGLDDNMALMSLGDGVWPWVGPCKGLLLLLLHYYWPALPLHTCILAPCRANTCTNITNLLDIDGFCDQTVTKWSPMFTKSSSNGHQIVLVTQNTWLELPHTLSYIVFCNDYQT